MMDRNGSKTERKTEKIWTKTTGNFVEEKSTPIFLKKWEYFGDFEKLKI